MSSEQWLEAHSHLIDIYKVMVRDTSHLVNKVMFPNGRIPTRPDVAQVAKLVVSLEERVYAIEDALVNIEDGSLKIASEQVREGLEGHLAYVEGALNRPSTILQQAEAVEDLTGRLERVEDKLDSLLVALKKIEARVYPEAV